VVISADQTILVLGVDRTAPFATVSAVDPATGVTNWTWHAGYSRATWINHLATCQSGGFVIAGLRTVENNQTIGDDDYTAWVARVDGSGQTRWQVDVAATRDQASGVAIAGLAVTPQCAVVVASELGSAAPSPLLVALTADEGRIAWDVDVASLGGFPQAVFSVGQDSVATVSMTSSGGARLSLLDATSGALRWQRSSENLVSGSFLRSPTGVAEHTPGRLVVAFHHRMATALGHGAELLELDAASGELIGSGFGHSDRPARRLVSHGVSGASVSTDAELLRFGNDGAFLGIRSYANARAVAAVPSGDALVVTDGPQNGEVRLHAAADDRVLWASALPGSAPEEIGLAPDSAFAVVGNRAVHLDDGTVSTALAATVESGADATTAVTLGDDLLVSRIYLLRDSMVLEVARLASASGVVAWTTRQSVATTGRHNWPLLSQPIITSDGSILAAAASHNLTISPDSNEARGVLVRLRASDGAVLDRETGPDAWLVDSLHSIGDELYAIRFRTGRTPASGVFDYAIDRLDGLSSVWRHLITGPPGTWTLPPTVLVTSAGVIFHRGTPEFQRLRRSDGTVDWQTPAPSSTPSRLLAHSSGDFYSLTRRDGPGGYLDIGVERIDGDSGASRWTTFLEGMPGAWDSHAFYSTSLADGLLLTWNTAPNPNHAQYSTAIALLGDDGNLRWQRLQDAGPSEWSTKAQQPVVRPGGTVLVPIIGTPRVLWSERPEVGLPLVLELSPIDGTTMRYRPMRTGFERGSLTADHLGSIRAASPPQVFMSQRLFAQGRPSVAATASIRVDGAATQGIAVQAIATQMPAVRRRLRVEIAVDALAVPPGMAATVNVALPYGLVADSVYCEDSNAQCLPVRRIGVVQQPLVWSGTAATRIVVEADAVDSTEVFGDLYVVVDVDGPVLGGDTAARVVGVPWALQQPTLDVFGDGFEAANRRP
jgi:hypothetical protein